MRSTDGGATWTAITLLESFAWKGIAYGNNRFVIISTNTSGIVRSYYSNDNGITWIPQTIPVPSISYNDLTYANGLFVAVDSTKIIISSDGISWTEQVNTSGSICNGITYGNGLYVAVAGNGTGRISMSTDAINWYSYNTNYQAALNSIAYGVGKFVAVGSLGEILTLDYP
jgi:hypothetical protein